MNSNPRWESATCHDQFQHSEYSWSVPACLVPLSRFHRACWEYPSAWMYCHECCEGSLGMRSFPSEVWYWCMDQGILLYWEVWRTRLKESGLFIFQSRLCQWDHERRWQLVGGCLRFPWLWCTLCVPQFYGGHQCACHLFVQDVWIKERWELLRKRDTLPWTLYAWQVLLSACWLCSFGWQYRPLWNRRVQFPPCSGFQGEV